MSSTCKGRVGGFVPFHRGFLPITLDICWPKNTSDQDSSEII